MEGGFHPITNMLSAIIQILWLASAAGPDYGQAEALLKAHDLRGAAQAASRALAAEPDSAPVIALMSRIEIATGDMDSAERRLVNAVAAHPSDHSLRFLLGFCLYLRNEFGRSIEVLNGADASDPQVNFYRALATEAMGKPDAAIPLYRKAIAMTPSAEPRLALARLLMREGERSAASQLIDDALAREPGSREALYEKGQVLLAADDAGRAAEFGERALSAQGGAPSEREIRYLLVRAYTKSGDTSSAARQRAAFEKLPQSLVR